MAQQTDTLTPETRIYTVSEITSLIKNELENRFPLVWIEGEVSNHHEHHSGHVYFTMKDDRAQIRAVLFRSAAKKVPFELKDGLKIVCRGAINVYEPRGEYQIIVEEAIPRGKGALQLAYEQLKEKLKKEGLFDLERKKKLPLLPKKVGLVTSPRGAAIVDILQTLERRFARLHIIIYPVKVQGEGAAEEIEKGIDYLGKMPDIDVIIVGRGGGSIEDLWAFNEERVARAIYRCPIPIISAVGHEIDFTIADFASDIRASTPSAAAEMVIEKEGAFLERIENLERRLQHRVQSFLQELKHKLFNLIRHRAFQNFRIRLLNLEQRVDELDSKARRNIQSLQRKILDSKSRAILLEEKMTGVIKRLLQRLQSKWENLSGELDNLSPLNILKKGYALCFKDNQIVKEASEVLPEEEVRVSFFRGELTCLVRETDPEKKIESRFVKEKK